VVVLRGLVPPPLLGLARLVAQNPSAPAALLEWLSRCDDAETLRAVARNPASPLRALARAGALNPEALLSLQQAERLREAVDPKTPPARLAELAAVDDPHTQRAVVQNPNTPREVLYT